MKEITQPTIGELIIEEFMKPLDLSIDSLSESLKLPKLTIINILNGSEKITNDISIRLGKYFGVSDTYFLNIQNDIDRRK